MVAKYDEYFLEVYGLVLENIGLDDEVKSADEFIEKLEDTTNNPYLNTILKKEEFYFVRENVITNKEEEWEWEVIHTAEFLFDDSSKIKIYANGSYWWIEKTNNKAVEKFFYYTD